MALEQEIIKLVRLSTTESVGNVGFSSPWISIGSGSLIRIKSISKLAKYFSQLFISIIAPMGFGLWVSRRCGSISYIIVSTRISRSILPIRIIVCRDNTWARNRRNCPARLDCTGRRLLWDTLDMNNFYFLFSFIFWLYRDFVFFFFFWTMKRHVTLQSHDMLHNVMS